MDIERLWLCWKSISRAETEFHVSAPVSLFKLFNFSGTAGHQADESDASPEEAWSSPFERAASRSAGSLALAYVEPSTDHTKSAARFLTALVQNKTLRP